MSYQHILTTYRKRLVDCLILSCYIFHCIASSSISAVEPLITESIEKRKFFDNTLRPYTSLAALDPKLSTSDYLKASQVTSNESKSMRHFIDDYMTYHATNRWTGSRYLIFQPWGAGGLGDRCNYLLTAYWMAVMSRRIFLLDWEVPFSATLFLSNANPNNLKIDMFYNHTHDFPRGVTARVQANTPFVSFLNATVHNDISAQIDEEILMSSKQTVIFKWNRLPHSFSHKMLDFNRPRGIERNDIVSLRDNPRFRRIILNRIFRTSERLRSRHFSESNDLGLYNIPYIAVHARLGQGVGEASIRFRRLIEAPETAAYCLARRAISLAHGFKQKHRQDPLPIYLATDTPGFRQTFVTSVFQLSRGKVRVLSGDWDVMHTNRLFGRAKEFSDQVVLDGLLDLSMLGYAQHIIAFYSSFARLALYMGTSESLTELRSDVCFADDVRWLLL